MDEELERRKVEDAVAATKTSFVCPVSNDLMRDLLTAQHLRLWVQTLVGALFY